MADAADSELLFFDTFSHENTEDSNLDLVQFTRPVLIKEVRIIPLGTRVEADVPGGHRLGATNPSSFKLELYVNNLSRPNAATFERLGIMEYDKNDIQLVPPTKVPTDGLILKGWYTTITLAVYGNLTKVAQERSSPPPPPPPQPRAKTQAPSQQHSQPENVPPPPPPTAVPPGGLPPDWTADKLLFTQPPPGHVPIPPVMGQGAMPPLAVPPIDVSMKPPPVHPPGHQPQHPQHPQPMEHDGNKFRDSYSDDRRDRKEAEFYDRTREPSHKPTDSDSRTAKPSELTGPKTGESQDAGMASSDIRPRDKSHSHGDRPYPAADLDAPNIKDRDPKKEVERTQDREYKKSDHGYEGSRDEREPSAPRSPSIKATSPGPMPDRVRVEEAEPGEIEEEDTAYSSLTPNINMIENMLSDGEIEERGVDDVEYETISSDEDLATYYRGPDMSGIVAEQTAPTDEDIAIDVISGFNPEQFYLINPQNLSDPSLTQYEIKKAKLIQDDKVTIIPPEAEQLMEIINKFQNTSHQGKWIEALEGLPKLFVPGLAYLLTKEDRKDVLDTLIDWAIEGLDLDKAIQQPETAHKVRHIKMGIKLTAALCTCDSFIAFRMLAQEVQNKLMDLFTSQYMSSSIKLQIVRALESTLYFHEGMDWFLGQHSVQIKTRSGTSTSTPYQRLVKVLTQKQAVRTVFALSALVRKIHLYELLHKFNSTIQSASENGPPLDKEGKVGEDVDVSMDTDEGQAVIETIGEEEIDTVIECLEEINKVMTFANDLIAQPKRSLPVKVRFESTQKPDNTYPGLYRMLKSCNVLEAAFMLLSSPVTSNLTAVYQGIHTLLTNLMMSLSGLLFLSYHPETVNGIIRALSQTTADENDELRDETPAQQLGMQMIHYLQAVQEVDQLSKYHAKLDPSTILAASDKGMDDTEALAVLHSLYSLTFSPMGREAAVYVLGLDDNMRVLMPFINLIGEDQHDARVKRSVCLGYTVLLLMLVVRNSDSVPMLQQFGHQLLAFSQQEIGSGKMADKINELRDWLGPLKAVSKVDTSELTELIKQLKAYAEDILEMPKGLVTVLRMLRQLAIPPQENTIDEQTEELVYKYVQLEMFASDCVPTIAGILQKVGAWLLHPWQRLIPQTGLTLAYVMSVVRPCTAIIKALVIQVIYATGTQFKDLTCLQSLFQLYTVLCSVCSSAPYSPDLGKIQADILAVLAAYTQPEIGSVNTDEALSNSLWTLMMKELLTYTVTAPYAFLSGLSIVSEVLPLPLPLNAREPLSSEDVMVAISNRKMWSAHLLPLAPQLQEIIKMMSGTSCGHLQQMIRRVVWQLTDLAPPVATMVVRFILDLLMESMDSSVITLPPPPVGPEGEPPVEITVKEGICTSHTYRIISLIAFLVNQAPAKAAFLTVTRPGNKGDEKYVPVIGRLGKLLNVVSDKPAHINAQEAIVSIFHALCDTDVTMIAPDTTMSWTEQLANALPSRDNLQTISLAVLDHISIQDHFLSSVLPALRTMTVLLMHDTGYAALIRALDGNLLAFYNLFTRINSTFSKDSSDCLATLSSACECLHFLVTPPMDGGEDTDSQPGTGTGGYVGRTMTSSVSELRRMLCWTKDHLPHPLEDLEKLLLEFAKEEESLKAVYDGVNSVIRLLSQDDENKKSESSEPELPVPESLGNQFAQRVVYILAEADDERLNALYWLGVPLGDDSDQEGEPDLESCNFCETSDKYCSDFNLIEELEKGSISTETEIAALRPRKRRAVRRSQDTINTSRSRGSMRRFVAPMRGRGFSRGLAHNGRHDPFRSRVPNTSRPPSMHVDDFVKMESQGPTGPANMNAKKPERDPAMGQGRGMDRGGRGGFPTRGQFFSPPGSYGRRDRGAPRGGYRNGPPNGRGLGFRNQQRGGMQVNRDDSPSGNQRASPWNRQARQQGFGAHGGQGREGENRMQAGDRKRDGGIGRFSHGGRGAAAGSWGRQEDRGYPSYNPGFERRDRGARHQRSFTK